MMGDEGNDVKADVYARFIEELDALTIGANDSAVRVVGELTRAVKRAQLVVDGKLVTVDERRRAAAREIALA